MIEVGEVVNCRGGNLKNGIVVGLAQEGPKCRVLKVRWKPGLIQDRIEKSLIGTHKYTLPF